MEHLILEKIQLGAQEKVIRMNKIGKEIGDLRSDFERIMTDYHDEEDVPEEQADFFFVLRKSIENLGTFQNTVKDFRDNFMNTDDIQEMSENLTNRSGQLPNSVRSDARQSDSGRSSESPGTAAGGTTEYVSTQENEDTGSLQTPSSADFPLIREHNETIIEDETAAHVQIFH